MEERRKKCSGKPERKGGRFPYRPKRASQAAVRDDNPRPDDPKFAELRPFVKQRKDNVEQSRQEQLQKHRRQAALIEDTRARREFEREEAERQRTIDGYWRKMKRRVKEDLKATRREEKRAQREIRRKAVGMQLAAYAGPIIDRRGRVGVYLASTYLAAKTSSYGCLKRLVYYITQPEKIELIDGGLALLSNIGEDRYEMAAGMELIEDANRAARANAKVGVTFILQLPHDVEPADRLRILKTWCEEKLAIHDLPYVAVLHKPTEKLGAYKTTLVRTGADVPANERNRRAITVNEARETVERLDRREAELRRRIERLNALKASTARFPALLPQPPEHRQPTPAKVLRPALQGLSFARPVMSDAHLAATARAAEALRFRPTERSSGVDDSIQSAPSLQEVLPLDAAVSVTAFVPGPSSVRERPISILAGREWQIDVRQAFPPSTVSIPETPCDRPAGLPIVAEAPHPNQHGGRHLSCLPSVERERPDLRNLSRVTAPVRTETASRSLSCSPASVEWSALRLRMLCALNLESACQRTATAAHGLSQPQSVAPTQNRSRQVARIAASDPADLPLARPISILTAQTPTAGTRAMTLWTIHAPTEIPSVAGRSLDLTTARNAGLARSVDETERAEKAKALADSRREAEERRAREREQFLRFLSLVALNPDWLEETNRGLTIAAHAPVAARKLYTSYGTDFERQRLTAEVRHGAIDGVHRLPHDLAAEVARRAAQLAPHEISAQKLPFMDERGRYAPAIEIALALLADNPRWLTSTAGTHFEISPDAPPAIKRTIERYESEPSLPALLASAKRHGECVPHALGDAVAIRVDQRRAALALGRPLGQLRVTEPGGNRLSAAMVEHLAQARLHPEWFTGDLLIGLGFGPSAPAMFRAQRDAWSDPMSARQLVIENAGLAKHPYALTPAMREQVTERVRQIAKPSSQATGWPPRQFDGPSR